LLEFFLLVRANNGDKNKMPKSIMRVVVMMVVGSGSIPASHSTCARVCVCMCRKQAAPLLYFPVPQVAQVEHEKPLLVPEHDPVRSFPVAQLVLEQVEHAVSEESEQPGA